MINLIKELETLLRKDKIIGLQDYLIFQLNSDGSGLLLTRGLVRAKIIDTKLLEYESLKEFYNKIGEMLGREIKFK